MLRSFKFDEKTREHVHVKKPVHPKDRTLFDFMLHSPNDESEVEESSLLNILESEVKRHPEDHNDTDSETTEAEFKLVEILLKEASIEGYNLSYLSDNFPNKFLLLRISLS